MHLVVRTTFALHKQTRDRRMELERAWGPQSVEEVIERLMKILGETAGHPTDETKQEIPYDRKAVRGPRYILTHQYTSVDPAA